MSMLPPEQLDKLRQSLQTAQWRGTLAPGAGMGSQGFGGMSLPDYYRSIARANTQLPQKSEDFSPQLDQWRETSYRQQQADAEGRALNRSVLNPEGKRLDEFPEAIAWDAYGQPFYGSGFDGLVKRLRSKFYAPVEDYEDKPVLPTEWTDNNQLAAWVDSAARTAGRTSAGVMMALGGETEQPTGWQVAARAPGVALEALGEVLSVPSRLSTAGIGAGRELAQAAMQGRLNSQNWMQTAELGADVGSKMLLEGLFNSTVEAEFRRRVAAGENPDLVSLELGNPLIQMAQEMILDPLNFLGFAAAPVKARHAIEAYEIMRRVPAGVDDALRLMNNAETAVQGANALRGTAQAVLDARKAVEAGVQAKALAYGAKQLTASGKIYQTGQQVGRVIEQVVLNSGSTEKALDTLRAMALLASDNIDDVANGMVIAGHLDTPRLLLSEDGLAAGSVMRRLIGDDPDKFLKGIAKAAASGQEGLLKHVEAGLQRATEGLFPDLTKQVEWQDKLNAVAKAGGDIQAAAQEAGIPDFFTQAYNQGRRIGPAAQSVLKTHNKLQKVYSPVNSFLSTVYMSLSPAYAVRNLMNNAFTIGVDQGAGAVFRSPTKALESMKRLGVTPKGLGGLSGGTMGVGKARFGATALAEKFEEWGAIQVAATAAERTMRQMLRPGVAIPGIDELVSAGISRENAGRLAQMVADYGGDVDKALNAWSDAVKRGRIDLLTTTGWMNPALRDALSKPGIGLLDEVQQVAAEARAKGWTLQEAQARLDGIYERMKAGASAGGQPPVLDPDLPEDVLDVVDAMSQAAENGETSRQAVEDLTHYTSANSLAMRLLKQALFDLNARAPTPELADALRSLVVPTKQSENITRALDYRNATIAARDASSQGKLADIAAGLKPTGRQIPPPPLDDRKEFRRWLWEQYYFPTVRTLWQSERDAIATAVDGWFRTANQLQDAGYQRAQRYLEYSHMWDSVLSEDEVRPALLAAMRGGNGGDAARILGRQFGFASTVEQAAGAPRPRGQAGQEAALQGTLLKTINDNLLAGAEPFKSLDEIPVERIPEVKQALITDMQKRAGLFTEPRPLAQAAEVAEAAPEAAQAVRRTAEAIEPSPPVTLADGIKIDVKKEMAPRLIWDDNARKVFAEQKAALEKIGWVQTFEDRGDYGYFIYSHPVYGEVRDTSDIEGFYEAALATVKANKSSDDVSAAKKSVVVIENLPKSRQREEAARVVAAAPEAVQAVAEAAPKLRSFKDYNKTMTDLIETSVTKLKDDTVAAKIISAAESLMGEVAFGEKGKRVFVQKPGDAVGEIVSWKNSFMPWVQDLFDRKAFRTRDEMNRSLKQIASGKDIVKKYEGLPDDERRVRQGAAVMKQEIISRMMNGYKDPTSGIEIPADIEFLWRIGDEQGAFDEFVRLIDEAGADEEQLRQLFDDQELYKRLEDLYIAVAGGQQIETVEDVVQIAQDAVVKLPRVPKPPVAADNIASAPTPNQAIEANLQAVQQMLAQAKVQMANNWGQYAFVDGPGDTARIGAWAKEAKDRIASARLTASKVADEARKFTLLSYPEKTGADLALAYIYPYSFWYTRSYKNWMKRLAENPAILANYIRYKDMMQKIHAEQPEWWRNNVNTNELLGLDSENPLYFNLEALLNPLNGLTGVDFNDPLKRVNWWTETADGLSKFGPSLWTPYNYAIALALAAQGEEEAASRWGGRLFPQTNLLKNALSLANINVRQPGGAVNEFDPATWIFSGGIDPYERRRIGRELGMMVDEGLTDPATAIDTARTQQGDLWYQAGERAIRRRAGSPAAFLLNFMGGVGLKARSASDMQIDRFDREWRTLWAMKEYYSPDEFRQQMDRLRNKYPWGDVVLLSRKAGPDRDRSYAYNVLGRIPPGQSTEVYEAVGMDARLARLFYDNKGNLDSLSETERQRFMAAIVDIGAVLDLPDSATRAEWSEASRLYRQMTAETKRLFGPDIESQIDLYYNVPHEARDAYLNAYPQVAAALSWQDDAKMNDPLLRQYYMSMEKVQKYYQGLMWADMEKRFGADIWDKWAAYNEAKLVSSAAGKAYFNAHPELKAYSAARGRWDEIVAEAVLRAGRTLRQADFALRDTDAGSAAQQDLRQMVTAPPATGPTVEEITGAMSPTLLRLVLDSVVNGQELSYEAGRQLDRAAEQLGTTREMLLRIIELNVAP